MKQFGGDVWTVFGAGVGPWLVLIVNDVSFILTYTGVTCLSTRWKSAICWVSSFCYQPGDNRHTS